MIDLHTHTSYSDGTWSVTTLLEQAEKAHIEVLSITDHDTLKAYAELQTLDYKKLFSGNIVTGIEVNTVYDGIAFELLAYDFEYETLKNWIQENYENNPPDLQKEFAYMVQSCQKNHIVLGDLEYDETKGWPIDVIFPEIKRHSENKQYFKPEEWEDIDVFFTSCITNQHFPVFIDFSIHYPTAEEVAKAVRKAGGKVFLAHAFRYQVEDTMQFINNLNKAGILDGIEVYHSSFTQEQTQVLENYCRENHLYMSGGSDCHGEKKANRKLGVGYGNMHIPKQIIQEWRKD